MHHTEAPNFAFWQVAGVGVRCSILDVRTQLRHGEWCCNNSWKPITSLFSAHTKESVSLWYG